VAPAISRGWGEKAFKKPIKRKIFIKPQLPVIINSGLNFHPIFHGQGVTCLLDLCPSGSPVVSTGVKAVATAPDAPTDGFRTGFVRTGQLFAFGLDMEKKVN
jgi:hypothetical protein